VGEARRLSGVVPTKLCECDSELRGKLGDGMLRAA